MKITEVKTRRLRAYLRDTERASGPQSVVARMLRRELDRRAAMLARVKVVRP